MAQLVWRSEPEGFASNGYRIRHIVDHPRYNWRLEVCSGPPMAEAVAWTIVSYHGSLRGARGRADSIEHERVRRERTGVRVALGVLMLVTFATFLALPSSPVTFVVSAVSLGIAVKSFVSALGVYLDWPWEGASALTGRTTRLDRLGALLLRSFRRRAVPPPATEDAEQVRVLPPQPPMLRGGS